MVGPDCVAATPVRAWLAGLAPVTSHVESW
jgi:hypothetical protein